MFVFFLEWPNVNLAFLNILSSLAVKKLDYFSDNKVLLVTIYKLLNNNISKLLLDVATF